MPILGCIALFIVLYLLLSYKEKENKRITDTSCKNCNSPIDVNQIVCLNCNQSLKEHCEGCGKIIDIGWRYCPYCGHVKIKEKE